MTKYLFHKIALGMSLLTRIISSARIILQQTVDFKIDKVTSLHSNSTLSNFHIQIHHRLYFLENYNSSLSQIFKKYSNQVSLTLNKYK